MTPDRMRIRYAEDIVAHTTPATAKAPVVANEWSRMPEVAKRILNSSRKALSHDIPVQGRTTAFPRFSVGNPDSFVENNLSHQVIAGIVAPLDRFLQKAGAATTPSAALSLTVAFAAPVLTTQRSMQQKSKRAPDLQHVAELPTAKVSTQAASEPRCS
jgi:hypothetical protein